MNINRRLRTNLILSLLTLIFIIGLTETSFCRRDRYVSFGLTMHYFDYEETRDDGTYLDSERNVASTSGGKYPMIGINARVNYTFDSMFFVYGNFELTYFNTQYDGFLQGSTDPFLTRTNNLFLRIEFNFGYTFQLTSIFSISPYIGMGFRFWSRDITSIAGYLEHYSWFYFPVGFKLNIDLGSMVSIGLDASIRFMSMGRLKAFFSKTDPPKFSVDMVVALPSEMIFRIELPVHIYFSSRYGLSIIPWYNYSAIGKSAIDYNFQQITGESFYEPKSRTHQVGVNLNFTIYFGNSSAPEPAQNSNPTALKMLSR